MVIVLTGGGTAGHITPILAVASELRKLHPKLRLVYIGEHGGKFAHLIEESGLFNVSYTIAAGKYRRYHNDFWLKRLFDVKTLSLNLRDIGRVVAGFSESYRLLGKIRPDVVLAKGGFVCVPVGLAAARRKIKLITHDSDTVPGLANRIISRWARINATGMPEEFYRYPRNKLRYTGIPLSNQYKRVTPQLQKNYRRELKLPLSAKILFVTGGSLGAQRLNQAVWAALPDLFKSVPSLYVVHQAGKGKATPHHGLNPKVYKSHEYVSDMWRYSGAADVVVTQASATILAELAQQGRAAVLLPSPHLAGGHHITNARYLYEHDAAAVILEEELQADPGRLHDELSKLLQNARARDTLAANIRKSLKTGAAKELAELLTHEAEKT